MRCSALALQCPCSANMAIRFVLATVPASSRRGCWSRPLGIFSDSTLVRLASRPVRCKKPPRCKLSQVVSFGREARFCRTLLLGPWTLSAFWLLPRIVVFMSHPDQYHTFLAILQHTIPTVRHKMAVTPVPNGTELFHQADT